MQSIPFQNMITALNEISLSPVDPPEQDGFYSWIEKKSRLLIREQNAFVVSPDLLPPFLSVNDFNFYSGFVRDELNRCYSLHGINYTKVATPISDSDATAIYCSMNFNPRKVVWVEFGFNVGREFRGKHPALILRNISNQVLIVAPISTNRSNIQADSETVIFNASDFSGLPAARDRFTVVNRVAPVSVYRVDVNSRVGSLKKAKFQEVVTKLKNYY